MALLRVEDIKVCIEETSQRIVDGLSFTVDEGEIFALIGPSGSGKTTTLRAIAGFERVSDGRIVFDRAVVEGAGISVPPEQRGIGFVFQELALFPHLNVLENVMFGLHRLPRGMRKGRALELLNAVELGDFAQRRPHDLSGGEQQRVALARSLAPAPRLVLMDEPFASLDPRLRECLRARVISLIKEERMTAIMVTHDHVEAMAHADRVAVMNEGRIDQIRVPGDPGEGGFNAELTAPQPLSEPASGKPLSDADAGE